MGCGLLIGLDEFTDRPPGAGGGGGEPTECASPADCPAGEHGTSACDDGACSFVCDEGFADCDGMPGCETFVTGDKENCGACGVRCGTYCEGSACNDPVDIDAGTSYACALLKDGSVWCWGTTRAGGFDARFVATTQPMRVALRAPAVQIATGGHSPGDEIYFETHACAILTDNSVQCWGSNKHGQLGIENTEGTEEPMDLGLEDVQQISTGGRHTCSVDTSGNLSCWGYNVSGQVGDGSQTSTSIPALVTSTVTRVSAGENHTCSTKMDGHVYCWGSNNSGQVGSNQPGSYPSPQPVSDLMNAIDVACGRYHTCAKNSFGAFCWGDNTFGQLGLGTMSDETAPQPVDLPNAEGLSLGSHHSGALVDGRVYMWGDNSYGQLGDGTAVGSLTPTDTGLSNVRKLALGDAFSCALTEAGVILCWGDNEYGQLGDGTTEGKSNPTPVIWP